MGLGGGVVRRLMVLGLVVSLSGVPLSFAQTGVSAGFLTGRIFVADGVTPRAGVVVKAANLSTSEVFTSTQTDKSGRYSLADLPSGRYQVAVETHEGLYVNQDQVPVLKGRKTLFSLALNPASVLEDPPAPEEPADQEPAEEAEAPAPEQAPEGTEPPESPMQEKKEKKEKKGKKEKTSTQEEDEGGRKGAGFWRSGWGVAVGLGGGAVVLGLLADSIAGDTKEVGAPPSPSLPE